jgi:hypothetical protein
VERRIQLYQACEPILNAIRDDLGVGSLASEVFLAISHRASLWVVYIIRPWFHPHLEAVGRTISYSVSLEGYRSRNC